MPLDQVFNRLFPFGSEESRPPRMLPQNLGAEKPPDGIHQAVANQGPHQAGRQGVKPMQSPGSTGHASRHDRHFLRHGQTDAGEGEEKNNAEVGTPLDPLDHVFCALGTGRTRV